MARAAANGIELEYDTFGTRGDPTVLLIMGMGAQMTAWQDNWCWDMARLGYHVVRFDNRDCGLSTHVEFADVAAVFSGVADPAYTVDTMADDTAGLLGSLGVDRAHVVGASMGGMIAQALAIRHPARVRSLVSIMSTNGDPSVPPPTPEAMAVLTRPPGATIEDKVSDGVAGVEVMHGSRTPFDADGTAQRLRAALERMDYPAGVMQQLAAVMASPPRTEALAHVTCPTLVIHGDADPLIDVEGGILTAKSVPGAELWILEGMGHDLDDPLMGEIVARLHTFFAAASS